MYRAHGSPENCGDGVTDSVQQHKHGQDVEQRPNPTCSAECEGRQSKKRDDCNDQSREPVSKFKSWHGPEAQLLPESDHCRVINSEKTGGGFVENMDREGQT